MIPNVIHLIFGLKENFDEINFSFIHYLTIKSAHECNKPDAIKFYYKYEPTGEWWGKSKKYLTPIKIEPPTEIFDNPLLHYAHQADVLRLEILIKEGGIYLDMDVFCLNSFANLRKYKCVMGIEENVGLCNAVILTEPNSEFLKIWYEEYRTFRSKGKDEYWNEHSVKLPLKIAKDNPKTIHIEDKFSFFWPSYSSNFHTLWDTPTVCWKRIKHWFVLKFISTSYCIHLTESLWWDKYLKEITPEYIKNNNNNFSKLSRKFLFPKDALDQDKRLLRFARNDNKWLFLRPLIKILIDAYLNKRK